VEAQADRGNGERKLYLLDRMSSDFPLVAMSLSQENISAHGHDFVELVYVRSGSCTHLHADRRYPIFAGDCFVILPGEEHGYEEQQGLEITNVLFFPHLLKHHHADLTSVPGFMRFFAIEPFFRSETSFRYKLHLSSTQQDTMATYCSSMEEELSGRQPGYKSLCTGLLLQMVVFLSRCFDLSISSQNVRTEFNGKQKMVEAAIAYLEHNYAGDVRVDDVARSAFISPSRLAHVFKDTTGMSLMDYLTQIRIDRAQQLLQQTGQTIAEISFELGIQSPAYFARLFKRMVGQSPTEYRKLGG
jgi:AraC-like DNA-binding protein